jgi:hypothetical protein
MLAKAPEAVQILAVALAFVAPIAIFWPIVAIIRRAPEEWETVDNLKPTMAYDGQMVTDDWICRRYLRRDRKWQYRRCSPEELKSAYEMWATSRS